MQNTGKCDPVVFQYENMNMVGHNAPTQQSVSFPVMEQKSVLN